MAAAPTVAVLRALGLGDLLTAVPALRAVARAFPDHRRVLATPAYLSELVGLIDPAASVVDVDLRGHTGPFPPLPPPLRGAAVAINLHGRGPQSIQALRGMRPDRLIAFGLAAGPRWRDDEHEISRWCRLLRHSGLNADPADLHLTVAPAAVGDGRRVAILHPGAASPARRWPVDRWAAVARAQVEDGYQVLITGSAAEWPLAADVARRADLGPGAVVAGSTTPRQLLALVAAAQRVVCGDTGVAHVATAVGTPSVVLFGPVSPAQWGPPAHLTHHRALWAGRHGDPHADQPDPGLLSIGADDVITQLRRLPAAA